MIRFHLPINPPKATSQSAGKRIMRVEKSSSNPRGLLFFKNKKQTSAEDDYLMLCAPHAPEKPIDGPVKLAISFIFPWRAGEPEWRRALICVPKTTKPDVGNMAKALEDCLTKLGFWNDDAQVYDQHPTKWWGDEVGITITIEETEIAKPAQPAAKLPTLHPELF